MRLLNTKTFELQYHVVPPKTYAILSHTWHGKELVFEEYSQDECRQYLNDNLTEIAASRSYRKIRYLCDQARRDDIPLAWIDTICIDKSSSAELAEAINSMFQWYRQATICYVYLDDVDTLQELSRSRWLTRGWTLQELIAPLYVDFYSKTWEPLGSKATLATKLSRATHISVHVLRDRTQMAECRVATKFSWAACRKTTRAEDQAYCLFGLFGVNMPLLYGEGEQAFQRLQMEILRVCPDESILAWSLGWHLRNYYHLPYQASLAPSPKVFQNMHETIWSSPVNRTITATENGYIKLDAKILVRRRQRKGRSSLLFSLWDDPPTTRYYLVLMCQDPDRKNMVATAFQIAPCSDSPLSFKNCFVFNRDESARLIDATEFRQVRHESVRLQNPDRRFSLPKANALVYTHKLCCITCTKSVEVHGYSVKALQYSNPDAKTEIEKGRITSRSDRSGLHIFQTLAFLHSSKLDAFVLDFVQCYPQSEICVKAYHAPLDETDVEVWLDTFDCTREEVHCSHTPLTMLGKFRLTLDLPRSQNSFSIELNHNWQRIWSLKIYGPECPESEDLTDWLVV